MKTPDIRGKWGVVTGASSGLGVEFARELARRGANLVLVARREERLRRLADRLVADQGIEARAVPLDLASADGPTQLKERLQEEGCSVEILVNNAGLGVHGSFLHHAWERERQVLQVDIVALVHLTKLFLPGMVSGGFGRILQVASTAAYQAVPSYATYGAAKAFVLSFGEALNHELRGTGVSCSVVSPGVTKTEFHEVAGHEYTSSMRWAQMQSADVARTGVRAMLKGRPSIVTGIHNAFGAKMVRVLPRSWATAIAGYFMTHNR